LRNIPYATRDHDVKNFFQGIEIAQDGVQFKYDKSNRPAGECYVRFSSSNDCRKAYEKNRLQFGGRILELRPLSLWEFQTATNPEPDETGATFSSSGGMGRRDNFNYQSSPTSSATTNFPEKRKYYDRDDNLTDKDKSPNTLNDNNYQQRAPPSQRQYVDRRYDANASPSTTNNNALLANPQSDNNGNDKSPSSSDDQDRKMLKTSGGKSILSVACDDYSYKRKNLYSN